MSHQRTARLYVYRLVFASDDVVGNGIEPSFEISDRASVRVVIIHSKTSTEIDVVYGKSLAFKVFYDFIHSLTLKREYFLHSSDLRADVEVETKEIDVLALLDEFDKLVEFMI